MFRLLRIVGRLLFYVSLATLGFLIGVVAIYSYKMRQGPALEPWHSLELQEEYKLWGGTEARSFSAYRALEDRLFKELEKKIIAATPPGAHHPLQRYQAGSAADPFQRKPDWNRSFELGPENPIGSVLLLHGMSDGPYSLRAPAEDLARRGYRVLGLRMPGHGTVPAGLRTVTWEDMAAVVRLGMDYLTENGKGQPIHIIGYSTGAALAVGYTLDAMQDKKHPVPASLVLVSPAIGVTPLAALSGWLDRLAKFKGMEQLAWTSIMPEFDPFRYNSFSLNASYQVYRMTSAMAKRIEQLTAHGQLEHFPPTLSVLTAVDATVEPSAVVDDLLRKLAPGGHELLLYDINRHGGLAPLLAANAAPLTGKLLEDDTLPFALTALVNESPESRAVVAWRRPQGGKAGKPEPLHLSWPEDVLSLSHVDLPFPPDDPLYGKKTANPAMRIFPGDQAIRSERGVLRLPGDWLMRLRYNPFYAYQQGRIVGFIAAAAQQGDKPSGAP